MNKSYIKRFISCFDPQLAILYDLTAVEIYGEGHTFASALLASLKHESSNLFWLHEVNRILAMHRRKLEIPYIEDSFGARISSILIAN